MGSAEVKYRGRRRLTRWQHKIGDSDRGKGIKKGNHTKADANLLPVNMLHWNELCNHI